MIRILFSAKPPVWATYEPHLRRALDQAGLDYDLSCEHPPAEVDYIVFAPNGPVRDFTPFVNAKAVLGLWAGVETVVDNATLTQPLARMVDDGLTRGMVEWVVGHALRHHLGMDAHIAGQDGAWRDTVFPPLAMDRPVAVLGMGVLGTACATTLTQLGFPVVGYSRRPKQIAGLTCVTDLDLALSGAQIVIALLPLTPETADTLNARTLALLAKGAFVINPGRGPLIDDAALLAALDSGQIAATTLDVFRTEPLPSDHPFWTHPRVTVTPHIASTTRPETAVQVITDNILRGERSAPFLHLVDRRAGY